MALAEWRVAREKTHAHMAKALHVGQPAGATPDNRDGMNAGNLRRCIEALGGTLEIAARVPDGVVVKRFEEIWGRKLVLWCAQSEANSRRS